MSTSRQPRFSVVIPARDMANTLRHTLPRVLSQSVRPLEIIVVDNRSSDGTSEMLARDFPDVQVVLEPVPGVGHARNAGIKLARGEYIAFMDADDFWEPHHLEVLSEIAQRFPNAGLIAASGGRWRVPLERLIYECPPARVQRGLRRGLDRWRRARRVNLFLLKAGNRNRYSVHSSTAAVRRDIVSQHKIKFPALKSNEDLIFWNSLALITEVAVSPARTVRIARHPSSATATFRNAGSSNHSVDCLAYKSRPLFEHLASNRESAASETLRSIDLYLDGIATGAWRSTLYLGLQHCAREACAQLVFPWKPQAMLLRLVASLPIPIGLLFARGLQALRPLGRYGIPLSPFVVWVSPSEPCT